MRVINVVKIKEGVVDEIFSFGIFEEQLSDEVVEEAEQKLIEVAKELGFDDGSNSEEDFDVDPTEELLDNGYFEIENASVCISWSDI